MLNDRSTAKRRETTANDRLLHFMAQLPPTTSLERRRRVSLKCSLSARAPRAATRQQRRRAWLRIFAGRCSLPCDPPVGVETGSALVDHKISTSLPKTRHLRVYEYTP